MRDRDKLRREMNELVNDLRMEEEILEKLRSKNEGPAFVSEDRNQIQDFLGMYNTMEFVIRNIDKFNLEKAAERLKDFYERSKKVNLYAVANRAVERDILTPQEAETLVNLQKKIEEIEEDLIKEWAERSKNLKRDASSLPEIVINIEVYREIKKEMHRITHKQNIEFVGLAHYRRKSRKLLIHDFEVIEKELDNATSSGITQTDQTTEKVKNKSRKEQFIHFHSHPKDGRTSPSEWDLNFYESHKQGIGLIGLDLSRMKSHTNYEGFLIGITAVVMKNDQSIDSGNLPYFYIPVKIEKDGKNVTNQFPILKLYNQYLEEAIATRKDPYEQIFLDLASGNIQLNKK